MCWHNHTLHNGCGHLGETHNNPYTLCPVAEAQLAERFNKSPQGTPLPRSPTNFASSSRPSPPSQAPPRRQGSRLTKRFHSISIPRLSRSTTDGTSRQYRRTVSYEDRKSTSSVGSGSEGGVLAIAEHEFKAVKCDVLERREFVTSDMEVCGSCKEKIVMMRRLVATYDRTGNVRGCRAFELWLKDSTTMGSGVDFG